MPEDLRSDTRLHALRGRIGAYATHSRHDPRETTANARRAFHDAFLDKADPDGVLSEEERARRAESLRREHFARLAYRSALVRRQRAESAVLAAMRRAARAGTTTQEPSPAPLRDADGGFDGEAR